jgi:hypothetical protein
MRLFQDIELIQHYEHWFTSGVETNRQLQIMGEPKNVYRRS